MRFEPGLKVARHKRFLEYLDGAFVAPINVEISPSGICNASCERCFYRQDPKKICGLDKEMFDEGHMERLLKEAHGFGVRSISWTGGGEPTLHTSFYKFVKLAYDERVRQGLFTNGLGKMKFDPSKLDWIRVTKTNHDWNVENLKYLRNCNTLGLCINYRGEIDDLVIDQALEVGEKVGVTYIQVRPALNIAGQKTVIKVPLRKHPLLQITDYKFVGVEEEREYELCEGFHFVPFIWQDGDVDVCGYHRKDQRFNLGNVYKESFESIMKKAPLFVPVIENCQTCCKLNAVNSTIAKMRTLEDVDFP
jgi:MoaA/NifB/PqqE/SkfB family radical SAM enzyme